MSRFWLFVILFPLVMYSGKIALCIYILFFEKSDPPIVRKPIIPLPLNEEERINKGIDWYNSDLQVKERNKHGRI